MKVLLLKDVYKLGRAGDVKRVADGYGRNYLIPQGLAVLATPGALKQVEHIRTTAATHRTALNKELGGLAQQLGKLTLTFPAKAGETGRLYGSITSADIAATIERVLGIEFDKHWLVLERPIREIGQHAVEVKLEGGVRGQAHVVVETED